MAEEKTQYELFEGANSGYHIGDTSKGKSKSNLGYSPETEVKVMNLKQSLETWREVILPIHSILHWEKQWHPFSIIGCNTLFFMLLWLLDPSILTTLSLIGLTLTLSDYLVPHLACSLLKAEPWTEKQEEKFDKICKSIVLTRERLSLTFRSFLLMRSTRPKMYYGLSIVSLAFLAWIGNNVNNLFLTFVIATFLCMMPGMEHHGILQKYGSIITDRIADMATNAKLSVDLKKDK